VAETFAAFHFLRPVWLWALCPFALYALALLCDTRARSPWAAVVEQRLLRHLIAGQRLRRLLNPDVLLLPLGALAVLAAAGPSWAPQVDTGDPAQSPLVILMELSRSMSGTDVSPSRAERARLTLRELVHARGSSPTALLVVAGSAHVLMPLTDDPTLLEPYLNALSPELMPSDGEAFARAPRLIAPLAAGTRGPLSVLVVSDGLPPDGASALAELHASQGVGFVVLGVGSSRGDPAHGAPALDRASLDRFASQVGAPLLELSFAERDVARIQHAIALHRARTSAADDAELWEDGAYLFAIPLAIGLALWFRRGWVLGRLVSLAGLVLLLGGCSGRVLDIWLTPDQQGQLLFDRGRYPEAAACFQDPMRRGLALYAQSKFEEAAAAFASLDDRRALYNLGNAYAQGGKLGSALQAYERALREAPTFRQARHNADLVREILQAQIEDTDREDMRTAEQDSGDAAVQLDSDQLEHRTPPGAAQDHAAAAEALELSPSEQAAWLRHVQTDPAEFLKHKLATQAARGGP
jgi:Ca-activated chloride channel family protein